MSVIKINWNPDAKTLRAFGLIGFVAFGLFGACVIFKASMPDKLILRHLPDVFGYIFGALAVYCGLFAMVAPAAVKPIYVALTAIGYPIGMVVSTLMIGVVFFGVITPIGLIFRLIGRDAMQRKFEPQAATYWIRRTPPADTKRYFRQF